MEKKKQHVVPNCYLKAWCDPATPDGQEPYIWIHPVGGDEPRRKSPRKSFTDTDRYTIESPSGDRNLRVEDTLANIETEFVRIREQLEEVRQISAGDHFLLCAFAAAMCSRTKPSGDRWAAVWDRVRSQANRLAQAHGAELDSPQLDDAVRNAHARFVEATVQVLTPMLFPMCAGIYYADGRGAFITSDNPCVWYDPDSSKRPPAHRSPALCYPNVKLLLALSPNSLLLFAHDKEYGGYRRAGGPLMDEVNRLIRFSSHEYFVTRDGRTNNLWFERRDLPTMLGKIRPKAKHAWLVRNSTRRCTSSTRPRSRLREPRIAALGKTRGTCRSSELAVVRLPLIERRTRKGVSSRPFWNARAQSAPPSGLPNAGPKAPGSMARSPQSHPHNLTNRRRRSNPSKNALTLMGRLDEFKSRSVTTAAHVVGSHTRSRGAQMSNPTSGQKPTTPQRKPAKDSREAPSRPKNQKIEKTNK